LRLRGQVSTLLRTYLCAAIYLDLQNEVRKLQPIPFYASGFISNQNSDAHSIAPEPFRMHLVIGDNPSAHAVLAYLGHPHSLASYFYIGGTGPSPMRKHFKDYAQSPIETTKRVPRMRARWDILEEYTY